MLHPPQLEPTPGARCLQRSWCKRGEQALQRQSGRVERWRGTEGSVPPKKHFPGGAGHHRARLTDVCRSFICAWMGFYLRKRGSGRATLQKTTTLQTTGPPKRRLSGPTASTNGSAIVAAPPTHVIGTYRSIHLHIPYFPCVRPRRAPLRASD